MIDLNNLEQITEEEYWNNFDKNGYKAEMIFFQKEN